jgi:hypothetical protein
MTIVGPTYHIRVRGHLGSRWGSWLGDMTITREPDGATLMTGSIVDEAALHGALRNIRDLGLILLSITRVEPARDASHRKDTP